MGCYFCRDVNATMQVHQPCKGTTLAGGFAERTLCVKCGKCHKCDHDELVRTVYAQPYAILQISIRRSAIIRLSTHLGLSLVDWKGSGQYLGGHREATFVEGCETLNYDTAHQRLADILYNPESEWRH